MCESQSHCNTKANICLFLEGVISFIQTITREQARLGLVLPGGPLSDERMQIQLRVLSPEVESPPLSFCLFKGLLDFS